MAKGLSRDSIDKDTKGSPSVLILIIAVIIILVVALGIFVSGKTGQPVSLPIVLPASLEAAQDYYIDGNYRQAIELLEAFVDRARPADRKLPLARDLLVSSYWQVDDHQQAFELLGEVVSANPNDIDSVYRLGLLAKELGRDELAADYFSQGKIGNTYAAQNLPDAARAEFEAGLGVEPNDQYLTGQLEALGP